MSPGDRREPFADNRFPPLLVNVASKRESREFSTAVLSYRDDLLPGNVSDKRMIRLLTNGLPTHRQPRNELGLKKWLRLSANGRLKSIAFPTLTIEDMSPTERIHPPTTVRPAYGYEAVCTHFNNKAKGQDCPGCCAACAWIVWSIGGSVRPANP